MLFEVGTFSAATVTGIQTITHGLGVTPKLILIWGTRLTAPNIATSIIFTFGAATSATARGVIAGSYPNLGNNAEDAYHSNAHVLAMLTLGGDFGSPAVAILSRADLDGFTSANFTLDWDTVSGAANKFGYALFAGDDISANVVNFQQPAAPGAQSVAHGLGATPTGLISFSAHSPVAPPSFNVAGQMPWSIGAHDITDGRVTSAHEQGQLSARFQNKAADNFFMAHAALSGATEKAVVDSVDATNVNLTWSGDPSFVQEYQFLVALAGVNVKAGKYTSPATAITQPVATGLTSVKAFLTWGWMAPINDEPFPLDARMTFGASDGTNNVANGIMHSDSTNVCRRFYSNTKCLALYNNSGTLREDASATFSGGTVNVAYSTAEAAANEMNYLAFETIPATPEEVRGLISFRLSEITGTITTAELRMKVVDALQYGFSTESVDGLHAQNQTSGNPMTDTLTIQYYNATSTSGDEVVGDYEKAAAGTIADLATTGLTAGQVVVLDCKAALQALKTAGATHMGIRVRQKTRDTSGEAIAFERCELVVNGGSANYTRYDGVGDYFHKVGGFLTAASTVTTVSGACWLRVQTGWSTSALFGESGTSGNFGWMLYISDAGAIFFMASDDGATKQWSSATGIVTADEWIHLAVTYNAGVVNVYKNGEAVAQLSNTAAASITRRSEFAIGADNTAGTPALVATVDLSRIVMEEVEWSSATVNDIMNGTVPGTAFQFPHGNGYESQQFELPLSKAGDPETFATGAFALTPAPPPVAPTTIWEFLSGDITEGDWNMYRAALATGSQGRPVGAVGTSHDMGGGELIFAPTPHEVADYDAGDLRCERYVPSQDHHTLLAADGEALDAAFEDFYLVKETDYVITCQWTLGGNSEADWRDSSKLTFGLLWEMWQPKTGPTWATWTGGGQAPIQIMINNTGTGDNELLLYLRGSTDDNTYTTTTVVPLATTLVAQHKVELRFRLSKTTTTPWSVFHNDVFKGSGEQEIGVDRSPGGSYSAGDASPQIGLYVGSASIAGFWAKAERHTIAKV